jgi:tetratricopeptide (TPR) repeat protein
MRAHLPGTVRFAPMLLAAALCVLPPAALAHGPQAHGPAEAGERIESLGRLDFPTSTQDPAAQSAFVRGMLLLHLFEYPSAKEAFLEAQERDPGFALAYWGEAMTYTHPIWNQQDVAAGRAALAKLAPDAAARAARAPSEREKAWLATAEILYGEGDKRERDAQFLDAMTALAARFPEDDEAKLFQSLALLGLSQGERDLPNFLEAARIAQSAYLRNPEHPGAAHYWIHGMDDPEHAAGALEAARSLSKIAPAAPHAQHMTSHIFMALGMWDDVVRANEQAEQVVASQLAARGQPMYRCGHYSEWLQYGYFQQGRPDRALAVLADCERQGPQIIEWMRGHPGTRVLSSASLPALRARIASSLVTMRAMAAVESASYAREYAGREPAPGGQPRDLGWAHFARGLAQATQGDVAGATGSLKAMQAVLAEPAPAGADAWAAGERYLQAMQQMLEGAIAHARGDTEGGLARVRAAAATLDAMPFDFGPPATLKPVHELAGDLLLAAGRSGEAAQEYALALKWAPRRALSETGLAHARDTSAAGKR